MGHVSSLSLFFAYEEARGRQHLGFIINLPETEHSESQAASEPQEPDAKK
jgi:hypothetical protein